MKMIPNNFDWYPNDFWWWSDDDTQLLLVNDWVKDIEIIMKHVPEGRRRVCVQAGGACGVWPIRFCCFFDSVYSFEPLFENWECMIKNAMCCKKGSLNTYSYGLGSCKNKAYIARNACEANNTGAWFTFNDIDGGLSIIPLDDLELQQCDLIQLDVEGAEYSVLKGAEKTISLCRPIIVIEEKKLPHTEQEDVTKARELLVSWEYSAIENIHRDVIFIP